METGSNSMQHSGGGKPPKKGPKFNFYWIYALIAVILLAMNFFDFRSKPAEISFQEFAKNYLADHDVERLDVVNGHQVDVYIKKDKLSDPKFKDVAKSSLGNVNLGPHYTFTIGNIESFKQDLNAAETNYHITSNEIDITYHDKGDWFTPILNILIPVLLFVVVWVLLMRKMGGGSSGGGPGGIFNIGKSKAQLFEKGTRVNITFNDVAGLDEAKQEVMEVVDFLKNPKKYTALGGKITKGA